MDHASSSHNQHSIKESRVLPFLPFSIGKQANSRESRRDPRAICHSGEQTGADPPAGEDCAGAGGAAATCAGAAHAARGEDRRA